MKIILVNYRYFISGGPERYMFNVKAFMTGKSAFYHLFASKGFIWMVVVILAGQILITTFGGEMFSVVPVRPIDWLKIIGLTSIVLWVGEIARLFSSN